MKAAYDVVIVGAGPAGLAAADATARAGLSTLLLDENPAPGGQIYRAIETTPLKKREILGPDYWTGERLVTAARASGAEIAPGAIVWTLDRDLKVGVSQQGAARLIEARRVIVATGALERPFPIPGWTLPGAMTVGAAQTMLKSSALVPEGEVVIAGTGPLIWLYVAQVLRAGGRVKAILDTTTRGPRLRSLRHLPAFLLSPYIRKGLALRGEVMRSVEVVKGVTALEATGNRRVEAVGFGFADGTKKSIAADTLLLHQGVVPNVNLASAAGVAHAWDPVQLCFNPVLDAWGGSSVEGIAVAGDGAGIAGALAAEERGRIAAIAAVRSLDPNAPVTDDQAVRQALARHLLGRRFIDELFKPADRFRKPADATIVCRCEEVTAGAIRQLAYTGCEGPNQMKAFLRTGMGPCQGRMCGLTVSELIADARGVTPAETGYFRLRPPVKPVTLAEIAGLPAGEGAQKAVVRL